MPGNNKEERTKALWQELKKWYQETKAPNRLDNLTYEMVQKKPAAPPKLRGKAAEVRGVLPFALLTAEKYQDGSTHRSTVLALVRWLCTLVRFCRSVPYPAQEASEAAMKVAVLYSALEAEACRGGNTVLWRVKPKLHLLQELCEYVAPVHGSPFTFQNYLDESIGGWVGKMGVRRGGPKRAAGVALNVLSRFRAFADEGL